MLHDRKKIHLGSHYRPNMFLLMQWNGTVTARFDRKYMGYVLNPFVPSATLRRRHHSAALQRSLSVDVQNHLDGKRLSNILPINS